MYSVLWPHQTSSTTMYVNIQGISQTVDHLSMWVYGSGMKTISLEQRMEKSKTS